MHPSTDFDLVLFGATGDLAMRKLLPALFNAHITGALHPQGRIIGVSRSRLSRDAYLDRIREESKIPFGQITPEQWTSFATRISYLPLDIAEAQDFAALAAQTAQKPHAAVVIYLATAPKFFAQACRHLAQAGLNGENVRIVLEKPLGTDLASCRRINDDIAQYFSEQQIYRIDHYLGKESLQNLTALRFGNALLEPLWNGEHIASVEITAAERLGVEERGESYDTVGALRDMVQNHIMQMLCLTAMERPKSLSADDVRDAKLQLIRSLKPLDPERDAVRGQYTAADGCKGYTEEHKVAPDSRTETYAALRCQIDTPRWAGVPFYLRTGKRLDSHTAEIALTFKPLSDGLFPPFANRIVIRLHPDETVHLHFAVKTPGRSDSLSPAEAILPPAASAAPRPGAYETLLLEAIAGRQNFFNRRDELEAAWAWLDPVLKHWAQDPAPPHPYPAGSRGPAVADRLIADDGGRTED